jgi:hypothetical protein
VLASLSEGIPNALLESIACGTPFVAPDVGGIREIVDVEFDGLVPAANPAALADAIEARLIVKRGDFWKPRSFEPFTPGESAKHLSRILRSIQSGIPISEYNTPLMHETMTENDVCHDVVLRANCEMTSKTTVINDRTYEDYFANDEMILGRTGEFFRIKKSATGGADEANDENILMESGRGSVSN